MIRVEGLTKRFPGPKKGTTITAVEGLDLAVEEGEVFGFLGPNGAGKTTTIRMLTGLVAPTAGRATVDGLEVGRDDREIRRRVGVLTESPGMYDRLSAEKNLRFFARLYGVADPGAQVEKYLALLGLWNRRREEVGGFSKGMRQKLALARALVHEPKLVFLDEPTSALDPEASRLVREFIGELRRAGRTIFLCTHNLDEADRLCDRVAIFRTRLVTVDTPANLRRRISGRKVVFHLARVEPAHLEAVRAQPFVEGVEALEAKLVVRLADPEAGNPVLVRALVAAGAEIRFVGELRRSLEDAYLELIGPAAASAAPAAPAAPAA